MYSRISIKNFRGIGSLEVDGLRRINLIVGRNNSGKTSFLESLFLLGRAPDPHLPTRLGQMRGQRLGRHISRPIMAAAVPQHGSKKSRRTSWTMGPRTPGEDTANRRGTGTHFLPFRLDSLPRTMAELPQRSKIRLSTV